MNDVVNMPRFSKYLALLRGGGNPKKPNKRKIDDEEDLSYEERYDEARLHTTTELRNAINYLLYIAGDDKQWKWKSRMKIINLLIIFVRNYLVETNTWYKSYMIQVENFCPELVDVCDEWYKVCKKGETAYVRLRNAKRKVKADKNSTIDLSIFERKFEEEWVNYEELKKSARGVYTRDLQTVKPGQLLKVYMIVGSALLLITEEPWEFRKALEDFMTEFQQDIESDLLAFSTSIDDYDMRGHTTYRRRSRTDDEDDEEPPPPPPKKQKKQEEGDDDDDFEPH